MNRNRIDADKREGRGVSKERKEKDERGENQCPFRSTMGLFLLLREARIKIGERESDYDLDRR